jgi:hypothetical protein
MPDDDEATYLIDRQGGCVQLYTPEAIETFKAQGFWIVSRRKYEKARAAQHITPSALTPALSQMERGEER